MGFSSLFLYFYFFKWEDTIKSITQVYIFTTNKKKKIQIITENKQNSHMHTIISEKKKYIQLITIFK